MRSEDPRFGLRCPGLDINAYLGRMLLYREEHTLNKQTKTKFTYVIKHNFVVYDIIDDLSNQ